jgi:hypothetical protein
VKIALALILGLSLGFVAGWQFRAFDAVGVTSNRFTLEQSLKDGIEVYKKAHGVPPEKLDDIPVAWLSGEPKRRAKLIAPFYYEVRGQDYILWWPKILSHE